MPIHQAFLGGLLGAGRDILVGVGQDFINRELFGRQSKQDARKMISGTAAPAAPAVRPLPEPGGLGPFRAIDPRDVRDLFGGPRQRMVTNGAGPAAPRTRAPTGREEIRVCGAGVGNTIHMDPVTGVHYTPNDRFMLVGSELKNLPPGVKSGPGVLRYSCTKHKFVKAKTGKRIDPLNFRALMKANRRSDAFENVVKGQFRFVDSGGKRKKPVSRRRVRRKKAKRK